MAGSFAPRSKGPLGSALKAFARFAAACPERTLFQQSVRQGDKSSASWNEWTFVLFALYLGEQPSKKTGKPVSVKSMESYISLLKGYFAHTYDFEIPEGAPRLSKLVKALQADQPMAGVRRKRRGLRRRHLREMWKKSAAVRDTSANAVNEHALLATAWHTLARGGELAPAARTWDARFHPTRADLSFSSTASGRRYAMLMLRPLKKARGQAQPKIPQYIVEHDGKGSDAYAALCRLVQYDPVPVDRRETTPLFRRHTGSGSQHMTVAGMRALVRSRMALLGYEDVRQWGAHSCRIGGATDLMSTGRASAVLLQAKGRWASDIGKIYARMTRRCQLAASELMQAAKGRDLEELLPDFAQPVM